MLFCLALFLPFCDTTDNFIEVNAQTSATSTAATFPVDSAGLSAYVKLNSFDPSYFETLQKSFYYKITDIGTAHIIGVKQYIADDIAKNNIDINVYLGSDGWLIAYISRSEIPSKIIDFKANADLDNTFLKQAINDAASALKTSYTGAIQYYDFSNPAANKISLIAKSLGYDNASSTSDYFTAYVPGVLNNVSFGVILDNPEPCGGFSFGVDGAKTLTDYWVSSFYGYPSNFTANKSHQIDLSRNNTTLKAKTVSLIIYQTSSNY